MKNLNNTSSLAINDLMQESLILPCNSCVSQSWEVSGQAQVNWWFKSANAKALRIPL